MNTVRAVWRATRRISGLLVAREHADHTITAPACNHLPHVEVATDNDIRYWCQLPDSEVVSGTSFGDLAASDPATLPGLAP